MSFGFVLCFACVFQDAQSDSGRHAIGGPFDARSGGDSTKMIIELLDRSYRDNPWRDMSDLDDLVKHTGLDDGTIKVRLQK
jgi:hypothetical protein